MKEIRYETVKEIAVLSTGDNSYIKEIDLISWNRKKPKYDVRGSLPNREKYGKGVTLNVAEAAVFPKVLQEKLSSGD